MFGLISKHKAYELGMVEGYRRGRFDGYESGKRIETLRTIHTIADELTSIMPCGACPMDSECSDDSHLSCKRLLVKWMLDIVEDK